jgi:16S rRNA processing protein RimM
MQSVQMTPLPKNKPQDDSEIVIIGKVGAPYGIKGWSKIFSYTVPIENILDYQPWLISTGKTWEKIEPVVGRVHNKVIVAQLPGSGDREQAKHYTHVKIAVHRQHLPTLAANQYYWNDLIGLAVINTDGELLGKVLQISETGADDVLIVRGEKDFAVPMQMDSVIKTVDLNQGFIKVDWQPIV